MSGDHPPEEGHASHETHKNLSEDHPLWPFLETLWANNGAHRPTMLDVAQFVCFSSLDWAPPDSSLLSIFFNFGISS